jgi:hypothetical protein
MKTIKIACQAADTVALESLVPLQGELKKLPKEAEEKLKKEILEQGFLAPFFVWKGETSHVILDGHQRLTVLSKLKAQGYEIPALPVVWIEATSERQARERVLAFASQYGVVTEKSLAEYLKESEINVDVLETRFEFPEIDADKIKEMFEDELEIEEDEEPEIEEEEIKHKRTDKLEIPTAIKEDFRAQIQRWSRIISTTKAPITDYEADLGAWRALVKVMSSMQEPEITSV